MVNNIESSQPGKSKLRSIGEYAAIGVGGIGMISGFGVAVYDTANNPRIAYEKYPTAIGAEDGDLVTSHVIFYDAESPRDQNYVYINVEELDKLDNTMQQHALDIAGEEVGRLGKKRIYEEQLDNREMRIGPVEIPVSRDDFILEDFFLGGALVFGSFISKLHSRKARENLVSRE